MIRTLRTKLLIGITPLFVIMVVLGLWAVVMFYRLGGNIDVILRENYQSVHYSQNMKESIERMDSALLFAIGDEEQQAVDQYAEFRPEFEKNLAGERANITLPGERAMVDRLTGLYGGYLDLAAKYFALGTAKKAERTKLYFTRLLPAFKNIKREADDILELNQRKMEQENTRARQGAAFSTRMMIVALAVGAMVAGLIALRLSASILDPIRSVTQAARAMSRGDLEQVVPVLTHDELGELAGSFNAMARTIREFNQAGTARLIRAQKTAQATIDSFPDPVVLADLAGGVERANPAARRLLHVAPIDGASVNWKPPAQLGPPLAEVLKGNADYLPTSFENAICLRYDGQERYFLPRVLAIGDENEGLLGAAIVLSDVTRFRTLDQLKSDMVSTVSHELKTPLTSIQMAVHLLLEEVVGPLAPKQVELLLAARQDSDRLLAMVNDLLDLTRIEQGRVRLDLAPIAPADLVGEAIERFETTVQDSDVKLAPKVDFGLTPVRVDRDRVAHVFDNLIANALAHTDRGGTIGIEAKAEPGFVRFVVRDTGEGIAAEHLPRLFERFFRVPGSRARRGAGLGLAITREIVEAHGGTIDVTSQTGRGSTFAFTLPSDTSVSATEGRGALS